MSIRVESGDTLWGIARRHRTAVDALVRADPAIGNLDLIYPGQQLNLPGQRDEFVGAGPTQAPQAELGRGAQGAEVEALQEALVVLGYLTREQVATGPGVFGPRTEAAVAAFQAARGVPSTGYYGPLTRAALAEALGASAGPTTSPIETPPSPEPDGLARRFSRERQSRARSERTQPRAEQAAPGTRDASDLQ